MYADAASIQIFIRLPVSLLHYHFIKVEVIYILTHNERKENDIVILNKKTAQDRTNPKLTKPLKSGDFVQTHHGKISHDDIIGSNNRDIVRSSAGKNCPILCQN